MRVWAVLIFLGKQSCVLEPSGAPYSKWKLCHERERCSFIEANTGRHGRSFQATQNILSDTQLLALCTSRNQAMTPPSNYSNAEYLGALAVKTHCRARESGAIHTAGLDPT